VYHKTKKKVHGLLHPEIVGDKRWDKIINLFIVALIILNVVAVMLETVKSLHDQYYTFFRYFDLVSVIIFTIEYVLRVWSSNHEEKYKGSFRGRLKYMVSAAALIDLIAILPYYLHILIGNLIGLDLRVLRVLRLLRFFRLFRLTAYTTPAHIIKNVFRKRKNDLALSFILAMFLVVIASCIMYYAEYQSIDAYGNTSKFTSIPATIYWAVVTLTTTGYGDMVPITKIGKVMDSIIMMTGVAFFALPAGIITAGFIDEFRLLRVKKTHRCPHCGEHIELDESTEHHENNH
jgi:voltage-gated potassium channel